MKRNILLSLGFVICLSLSAQEGYYDQKAKKAMDTLSFMVGDWKGEGWIMNNQTREKMTFAQEEHIKFGLDSTVIIIEGKGMSEGEVVHDALAIISPKEKENFYFTSFLGDGRSGKYDIEFVGDNLVWKIKTPQGVVRFTISYTSNTWVEKGDFGMNGQWYPFFEMNLKKLEAKK